MAVYYVDLENGNDALNGTSYANRKKTIASALSASTTNFDEIRVMGNESPTLLGNATWTSDQIETEVTITSVDVSNPYARITLSGTVSHWDAGDWVRIRNSNSWNNGTGSSLLNGLWRISSKISSTQFELDECDTSGATSGGSGNGTALNTTASIVVVDGELVKSYPLNWTVTTIPNPQSGLVELNPDNFSGICHTTYHYYYSFDESTGLRTDLATKSLFVPRPQSSWRLTTRYLNNSYNVLVEEIPYAGYLQTDLSSMTVIRENATGQDNNSYLYSPGFNVQYGTYLGASMYVNTNSYVMFGSSTNVTAVSVSNPSARKICVAAKDNCAKKILRKTEGASPNRVSYLYFEGKVGAPDATAPADLIWEMKFHEAASTSDVTLKDKIEIHVHENSNWSLINLEPSVSGGDSKYGGAGYLIYLSGTPANTSTAIGSLEGPTDVSAFTKISANVKLGNGTIPSGVELRINYGSGSYYSIPIPTDLTTDWISLSYAPGGPLPNNLTSIEIFNTGSEITDLTSIHLSDFTVLSSAVDLDACIGRNIPNETWYKVLSASVKYGKTIFTLAPRPNQDEWAANGLSYLNGENVHLNEKTVYNNVPTYMVKPIPFTSTTVSNKKYKIISGGWDRNDMSTQSGETWITLSGSTNNYFVFTSSSGCELRNFGLSGGCTYRAIECLTGIGDMLLENVHANYNSGDGFYSTNFSGSMFKDCHFVGNTGNGIRLDNSHVILLQNVRSYCNGNGLYQGSTSCSSVDSVDLKIRGNVSYNFFSFGAHASRHHNLDVSAAYGQAPMSYQNSYNNSIYGLKMSRPRISSQVYYSFTGGDGLAVYQSDNTHNNTTFSATGDPKIKLLISNKANPSGTVSNYELLKITSASYIQPTSTTLWNGSTGDCYRFWMFASSVAYAGESRGIRFDLTELPVAGNQLVTVKLYVKSTSALGHIMQMRLDTSSTDIGISDDVVVTVCDGTSSTIDWNLYELSFTPTKNGIAKIIMNYWVTNGTSGVMVYFGGLEVT